MSDKARKLRIFSRWVEYVKDGHAPLMEMDKASLLIAAQERQTGERNDNQV